MGYTERKCNHCGKTYMADNRNLNRGWGLCCSKSCAARKREGSGAVAAGPILSTVKRKPRRENYYTMLGYNYDGSTFIDEMNGLFSNEDN